MYANIVWERTENVVAITLNRPRVLNALNKALKGELADALMKIKHDEGVRAVVLTGAGDQAFSAGQDLTEAKDMSGPEAEEWVREFETLYDQVRMLDVPVIAAVNGWAMGAGCQLALLADIRISSDNARYGMPEIRDGIPAVFGLELLWNTIGMSRGLYLVLSGDSLDAKQAQEAGLTVKVVPRRDLMAETMTLARAMARFAPIAMKQNKQYARRRTESDFRACARFCESAHHASFAAGDAKRGMEAFLSKQR
ncbi:MAG TPA: enoyl-CoA hydratase/isomerase family protein [Methylomirabilota bacterium]|jgi:enoyl-CoA hydratase/carnithine racemase